MVLIVRTSSTLRSVEDIGDKPITDKENRTLKEITRRKLTIFKSVVHDPSFNTLPPQYMFIWHDGA
jgi:hypothetical protein